MSNLVRGRRYNNLAAALRFAFEQERKTLYTAMPGVIEAYDADTQTASVRGAIDVEYTDGVRTRRETLTGVPVLWPGGGGRTLQFELEAGDDVLLIYAMRGLEHWKGSRGCSPPGEGILDEIDAIAVPGFGGAAAIRVDADGRVNAPGLVALAHSDTLEITSGDTRNSGRDTEWLDTGYDLPAGATAVQLFVDGRMTPPLPAARVRNVTASAGAARSGSVRVSAVDLNVHLAVSSDADLLLSLNANFNLTGLNSRTLEVYEWA